MEQLNVLAQESTLIRYSQPAEDIHLFTFLEPTRPAVDEFFRLMLAWTAQQIAEGMTPDDTVRLIVDFRVSGTPAMNYIYQRSKDLRQHYSVDQRSRSVTAILFRAGFLVSVAQSFVGLLTARTRDKMGIFSGDNAHEEALAWLLRDEV